MKKAITSQERRHVDYLRRQGMKTGAVYMNRLVSLRRAEVKRVLDLCKDFDDRSHWRNVIMSKVDESPYFGQWMKGLYLNAGLPQAKRISRDLSRQKAADPSMLWESALMDYATERAGSEIVIVTGTLKDTLVDILSGILEATPEMAVEKLTKEIFKQYADLEKWQCRRIAQTETMVGMAEAGRIAADSMDVKFVKQWACSGLANTRDSHLAMDGVIVGQDDYFDLGDCRMLYPHDNSLRPPASEIINCACDCIRRPI